jgi:hypothetical protein
VVAFGYALRLERRTSGAKALIAVAFYGPTKVVP